MFMMLYEDKSRGKSVSKKSHFWDISTWNEKISPWVAYSQGDAHVFAVAQTANHKKREKPTDNIKKTEETPQTMKHKLSKFEQ